MSLRWKILIVITATALGVIGGIFALSETTFMKSYQTVEQQDARQMAQRTINALSDQIEGLQTLNHDWAAWDDTYNFVQHPDTNENYIESNPTDTTFSNARLSFIFIINNSDHLVFGKAYDLNNDKETSVPESVSDCIYSENLVHHKNVDDKVAGIVMLPEGPLMVSSLPIITSQGEGPIAGTIIMARFIGATEVDKIAESVQLPVSLIAANGTDVCSDFQIAHSSLSNDEPFFARPIDSQSIAGYALQNDINGNPALILRATMPRNIYAQGLATMRYFLISLLGLAVLFIFILNFLLGRIIIKRVSRVANYVNEVRASGDLSKRLKPTGNDELSSLKRGINCMVEALQTSQESLQIKKVAEEKLRLTIESVIEGIATTDLEGKIIDVNDSKVLLHGYSRKEGLIGKQVFELICEEDRGKAKEALQKTLESGTSGIGEYCMLKEDGSKFFGERSAALLKDPDGKPTGFVISTKDITERKRAEEYLRKSEKKYAELVEHGNDGIILIQDDRVIFTNLKMREMVSRPQEEVIGRPFIDFVGSEYRGFTKDRYKKRMLGEKVSNSYEIGILSGDGRSIPVEVSASVTEYEGRPADMAIVRDITERKKAEEILKISEAKFRNLVRNAAAGIMTSLPDGRILSSNSAALELTGFGSEEELKRTYITERYTNPEDRERLHKIIQEKGVAKGFEAHMVRKNGTSFWASLNVMTDKIESGEQQFITIIEDITDRKKAEMELARLNQELRSFNMQLEDRVKERTLQLGEAVTEARAANHAKSEFLASMSHELRTPLNAIIGFSQVLQAKYFGNLNEKQSEYVEDILGSGRHLLSLINDILDLSKIEAGKMELEISEVKITDLLQSSLVMIKEKAHDHNIRLEMRIADEIKNLEIAADERKIKQVVFNLLSNASKFTPDGGCISVEARKENESILISVTDTGIGISDMEKNRLFEAFYQASGGIKDKTPGTGLGLKITKSIIEKHGGRIWVESEGPRKGSRFFFTLPIRVAAGINS